MEKKRQQGNKRDYTECDNNNSIFLYLCSRKAIKGSFLAQMDRLGIRSNKQHHCDTGEKKNNTKQLRNDDEQEEENELDTGSSLSSTSSSDVKYNHHGSGSYYPQPLDYTSNTLKRLSAATNNIPPPHGGRYVKVQS